MTSKGVFPMIELDLDGGDVIVKVFNTGEFYSAEIWDPTFESYVEFSEEIIADWKTWAPKIDAAFQEALIDLEDAREQRQIERRMDISREG